MVTFNAVCEEVYRIYRAWGFPGIGGIVDAGDEWSFFQAPTEQGGEIPLGEKPLFVNKTTGNRRVMVFDVPDMEKLQHAKPVEIPTQYLPKY